MTNQRQKDLVVALSNFTSKIIYSQGYYGRNTDEYFEQVYGSCEILVEELSYLSVDTYIGDSSEGFTIWLDGYDSGDIYVDDEGNLILNVCGDVSSGAEDVSRHLILLYDA